MTTTKYHDHLLAIESAAEKLGPKSDNLDRASSHWKQVANNLRVKLNEQEAKIEAFGRQAHVISEINLLLEGIVSNIASMTESSVKPDATILGKIAQIGDALMHLQLTPADTE